VVERLIGEDLRKAISQCKRAKAEILLEKESESHNFSVEDIKKLEKQLTAIIFCNQATKDKITPYISDFENVEFFVSKAMENDSCCIDVCKKEFLTVID
jgi:hypothetical protein